MEQKRIEWIDYAKGIVIFLMVCGHTSMPRMGSNFIWSFHMPFFFFISGMLFNKAKYSDFKLFLTSRVRSLFIPFLAMTMMVMGINYLKDGDSGFELSYGWHSHALWFVEVLVICQLCMWLPMRYANSGGVILTAVIMLVIGYILYLHRITLPYKLMVVPWASFYYGIGYVCRDFILKVVLRWWWGVSLMILVLVIAQLLPRIDMCDNTYRTLVPNNLLALLGIFGMIVLSKTLSQWNPRYISQFFLWAGKNTIVILGFSQTLNMGIKDLMSAIPMHSVLNSSIRHPLLWIVLFILSVYSRKYLPWVVGK